MSRKIETGAVSSCSWVCSFKSRLTQFGVSLQASLLSRWSDWRLGRIGRGLILLVRRSPKSLVVRLVMALTFKFPVSIPLWSTFTVVVIITLSTATVLESIEQVARSLTNFAVAILNISISRQLIVFQICNQWNKGLHDKQKNGWKAFTGIEIQIRTCRLHRE
jgi:hypothetical protein